MTEAELAEIEARANAATPGPWKIGGLRRLQMGLMEQDADFVTAARTDVPALVAEVRRLLAALAKIDSDTIDPLAGAIARKALASTTERP